MSLIGVVMYCEIVNGKSLFFNCKSTAYRKALSANKKNSIM